MKKYLLVCWDHYYPSGGLGNIKASFDSVEEYKLFYKDLKNPDGYSHDYNYIYDRDSLEVIKEIYVR